jgi:uncharacterized coiled-coil DUF342 family protein
MNKTRRNSIKEIIGKLSAIQNDIEYIRDEEDDCYASLPENFQDADKGQEMEKAIDLLDDASNSINEAIETLENI